MPNGANEMKKSLVFAVLMIAMTGVANADKGGKGNGNNGNGGDVEKNGLVASAPEIDPSSAIAALTLLTGGLVVLRGKRQR
jgi:hypothetical protein